MIPWIHYQIILMFNRASYVTGRLLYNQLYIII
jgi:hypothetical protein